LPGLPDDDQTAVGIIRPSVTSRPTPQPLQAGVTSPPSRLIAGHATEFARTQAQGVSRDLQTGDDFGARYRIESLIGEGGMGKVYKAYDKELDRVVALKLVRAALSNDPASMQRCKQELLLASKIPHKNIMH